MSDEKQWTVQGPIVGLPSGAQILIDHVDKRNRAVRAFVVTRAGVLHRLGHLRDYGWFCQCRSGTRCRQIRYVKAFVPEMEPPK